LPSVTSVVNSVKKDKILEWRNRVGDEEANRIGGKSASRGHKIHSMCESYLKNKSLGEFMPDSVEMFQSIKSLLNNISDIWYLEQALYSLTLKLAGRVDCIAHYEGELSVIDFKTSLKKKRKEWIESYFWQETAYALMIEELIGEKIPNIVTIIAVEGDAPQVFKEKTRTHIPGLIKAIQHYNNTVH
jgi:genome maintenance exonuclease 1